MVRRKHQSIPVAEKIDPVGRPQTGFPDEDWRLSMTWTAERVVCRYEAHGEGKPRVFWKESPLGIGLAWPSLLW